MGNNQKDRLKKTIAVFQYDFPIHMHTINLLVKLAIDNYNVKLFIGGHVDTKLADLERLHNHKNIEVYNYKKRVADGFFQKIKSKVLKYTRGAIHREIVENDIFQASLNVIKELKELTLIGIEKKGLIWAGKIYESVNSSLIYYSLELYLEDHPAFKNDYFFNKIRKEEIYYHKKCIATIIQDTDRKNILYAANKVNCDSILIPVSIMGGRLNNKDTYLHNLLDIHFDTNIILYIGMISENRFGKDFISSLDCIDKKYKVVLHGFGNQDYIDKLRSMNLDNLIISEEILSENELLRFVNSAYIGLALYSDCCNNDRMTAYSSGKIAQYCQCGVPFISLRIGNYLAMQKQIHCCELLDNYFDLNGAIQTIERNYEIYRHNAYKSFLINYDFDRLSQKLIKYLSEISPSKESNATI